MATDKHLTDAQLEAAGIGVAHYFGGKAYVKETFIKAGAKLMQHAHEFDHLAYLVSGEVIVQVDGELKPVIGPHGFLIPKGAVHGVTALTNAIWLCIWGTDCVDADKVDQAVSEGL